MRSTVCRVSPVAREIALKPAAPAISSTAVTGARVRLLGKELTTAWARHRTPISSSNRKSVNFHSGMKAKRVLGIFGPAAHAVSGEVHTLMACL